MTVDRGERTPPAAPVEVFYDPLSYAAFDHPYDIYASLREHAPVYYNARRDLWVLSRYADVKTCLGDSVRYVNALGNDMDGTHDSYGPGNLIALDDPHHALLREVVQPSFAGRELRALEGSIRAIARESLARLAESRGGDVAAAVALPVVFDTGLRLIGAPVEDSLFWQEHLLRSMERKVGQFGIPSDAAVSNQEAEIRIGEVIAQRRDDVASGRSVLGPDVISQLLLASEHGILDEAEATGLAHLVLSAATDAPAALVTNCVTLLDKYPELQQFLRRNPNSVKGFVEETLRYDTPGTNLCRQTTSDVTFHGVTIPHDSRVMILLGSANRDPRVFDDPDNFDISRQYTPDNRILSFGDGVHSCLGAPLARLIAQVVIEELLALLDELEMRVVGIPQRWTKQMVRGFSSLPVTFQPVGEVQRTTKRHSSTTHLDQVQHLSARAALATRERVTAVRVKAKDLVAEGVVALTLESLDESALPEWTPGAHVDLVITGVPTKQYSLSGDVSDPLRYRLGILRDEHGAGASRHVHDHLAVGDEVIIRGPRNNFAFLDARAYIFIAGGIGITPILPMVRAAEAAGAEWTLLYGGRTRASMAFLDELEPFGDRVQVRPQDEHGLLRLEDVLGAPREATPVSSCGPEPLLTAVEARCATWPKGSLHLERFAAKPLTEPVLQQSFEIVLARSGLTALVPLDTSILAAVENAGVAVRSSCTEGTCGTCETVVLEGIPDHRDSVLDEVERVAGASMMICVSRSCTPRLVLDL
jgi:cytochrome P450/ferredoxin-NADP reductase